eukprot:6283295-Pyramimonas_sp.AAC.1
MSTLGGGRSMQDKKVANVDHPCRGTLDSAAPTTSLLAASNWAANMRGQPDAWSSIGTFFPFPTARKVNATAKAIRLRNRTAAEPPIAALANGGPCCEPRGGDAR